MYNTYDLLKYEKINVKYNDNKIPRKQQKHVVE